MKKPLGKESPVFYVVSGPNLHILDDSSIPHLVEAANLSVTRGIENPTVYGGVRTTYQDSLRYWLERVFRGDSLETLTGDLNGVIQHIPYTHLLGLTEDGSPRWEQFARMEEPVDSRIRAAQGIAHFLASNGFRRLRRCQASECHKFFLGPPQSKWCCENCGSRERGREKRKKDRKQRFAP
jgi:predicted RNA-binding Zn ribbon-like protein